jgi:selenoprotein W-related protein
LKASIEQNFPEVDVTLIKGSNGVFEVERDGKLVFSKKQLGRFPDHDEIFAQLS